MDKRVIFLPAASQIKRLFAAVGFLIVAACAAPGQAPPVEGRGGGSSDDDATMHIAAAERLVDVGEYESALEEYLAAARASEDPEIARMVTRLAARVQDWKAAVAASERWLELDPDADSPAHVRVIGLVNLGRTTESIAALERWLERDSAPEEAGWWRGAAMLLAVAGEAGNAQTVYERLAAAHGPRAPAGEVDHAGSIMLWRQESTDAAFDRALAAARTSGEPDHLEWAAQLAVEQDDLPLALSLYEQAREAAPGRAELAMAEAEVLRRLERDEQAVALLEGLDADSETLYTLGAYLVRLGHDARAREVWGRMAALPAERQRDGHAFLVAQLAELVGEDAEALAWYDRVEPGPREREALLREAVVLGRLGRLQKARELLGDLRSGSAEFAREPWLIEAELLRSGGRPEAAVALLAQPLAEHPDSVDLLYARAISAATAGNVDLAEQDLRRIIQIDGGNAMALNALGYTLTDLTDRHQEAYRLIKRALELDPDDAATLDSMGWVLYRLDRGEEAVPYLQRALESGENPEIMAHLIEVLDHVGRVEEARALAEEALATYPEDDYLERTLERLGMAP